MIETLKVGDQLLTMIAPDDSPELGIRCFAQMNLSNSWHKYHEKRGRPDRDISLPANVRRGFEVDTPHLAGAPAGPAIGRK